MLYGLRSFLSGKPRYEIKRNDLIKTIKNPSSDFAFSFAVVGLGNMANDMFLKTIPAQDRYAHLDAIQQIFLGRGAGVAGEAYRSEEGAAHYLKTALPLLTKEEGAKLVKSAHQDLIALLGDARKTDNVVMLCRLLGEKILPLTSVLDEQEKKAFSDATQNVFLNMATVPMPDVFNMTDILDEMTKENKGPRQVLGELYEEEARRCQPMEFLPPFMEKTLKHYAPEERLAFVKKTQDALADVVKQGANDRIEQDACHAFVQIASSRDILSHLTQKEAESVVMHAVDTLTERLAAEEDHETRVGYLNRVADLSMDEGVLTWVSKYKAEEIVTHAAEMIFAEHDRATEYKADIADIVVEMVYDDHVRNALDDAQYATFVRKNLDVLIGLKDQDNEYTYSYTKLVNYCVECEHFLPFVDPELMERTGYADIRQESSEGLSARLEVMEVFFVNKDEATKNLYLEDYKQYAGQLYDRFLVSATDLETFNMEQNAHIPQDYQKITTFIQKYRNEG